MHPDLVPGGAQTIAKRLHDAHLKQHGPESSLFIAAMVGGGPKRPAGSNIVQLAPREFLYVAPSFDYEFYTNFDEEGQSALMELIESFDPGVLHFHHFCGFGIDFVQAALTKFNARSVFTVHEHLLICNNDGHLLQRNNQHICTDISYARCSTCMPQFRYDYFQQRMGHFSRVIKKFSSVTAVSQFTADIVGKALSLPKPIQVIPNGPVHSNRVAQAEPLDVLKIAFIGQIHPTKGVHLLLESLLAMCKGKFDVARRIDLAIWGNFVGTEEYRERIDKSVSALTALGVPVAFPGAYDASDLSSLLADRNVVVVPSLWPESYCLTADEAVQLGKILVCAEFPAIAERFPPSDRILYFPMGSAGGLRNRLSQLLERGQATGAQPIPQVPPSRGFASFDEIYALYSRVYEVEHAIN
jgi:glycosyltransferase involved in cell wall biosynthesis